MKNFSLMSSFPPAQHVAIAFCHHAEKPCQTVWYFSTSPLAHSPLQVVQTTWLVPVPEMPSAFPWPRAPATVNIWEQNEWDKECAELHWKRHQQLLLWHQENKAVISKILLCVVFLSQTANTFSYSSAPPTSLMSPVSLYHMTYSGYILLSSLHAGCFFFLVWTGLSLAFTQEISLKHQEACKNMQVHSCGFVVRHNHTRKAPDLFKKSISCLNPGLGLYCWQYISNLPYFMYSGDWIDLGRLNKGESSPITCINWTPAAESRHSLGDYMPL